MVAPMGNPANPDERLAGSPKPTSRPTVTLS
jgi:hypothetical protein